LIEQNTAMNRTEMPVTDVFISYTREDHAFANALYMHLAAFRAKGRSVFFDTERIKAGDWWRDEIDQAIEGTKLFVLLVSKEFLASDFCMNREVKAALARNNDGRSKVFVVGISSCVLKDLPPNPPGGKGLSDMQLAGPFDSKAKLIWFKDIVDRLHDAAWIPIVEKIHANFDSPKTSVSSRSAEWEAPEPKKLVAECDRGNLIKEVVHLAAQKKPALVVTTGHTVDGSILNRLKRSIEEEHRLLTHMVHIKSAKGPCTSKEDFENRLVRDVHCIGASDEPPVSSDDVITWALNSSFKVILVGHVMDGGESRKSAKAVQQAIEGAAEWLASKGKIGVTFILVLSLSTKSEMPPKPAAFVDRMLRMVSKKSPPIGTFLAQRAGANFIEHAAVTLDDYRTFEVDEWREHQDVASALMRRPEVMRALNKHLEENDHCTPHYLWGICTELMANP
jgi:hypothetical protein